MNKEQRIDFAQSRATETYPLYRWAAGSTPTGGFYLRAQTITDSVPFNVRTEIDALALDQPTFEVAVDLMARRIVDELDSFLVLDDFED